MYPNYYGLNMNMSNPYQNYNQNYGPNYSQNNFPSLQMQQPKENLSWINVNGIQGARDVQIQANQTAWLMDSNEPIFYVKQADNMGVCTLKAYKFEEINPEQPIPTTQSFVTKEEFEQFKNEMRNYRNEPINKKSNTTKSTTKPTK